MHKRVGQEELVPGGAEPKALVWFTSQRLQYSMVIHICHWKLLKSSNQE